ncbi:hypothetical protein RND71_005257 [Anisodus tanguticus]|uniref:Uncharacterized protein n=1 Tax=Anisodus tanguticus TaxID=243964 RepID=A0AAE1SR50_9SOLA|nr:hypothetical protein RND71_005257 [Anisodus tanguticus]
MSCSLNIGFSVSTPKSKSLLINGLQMQLKDLTSREFLRKPLDHRKEQVSVCVGSGQGWWEKTLKPNMVEINSAQQLVDSLLKAGDRLVVVEFYSPACGGSLLKIIM